jgi:hypothetical protein
MNALLAWGRPFLLHCSQYMKTFSRFIVSLLLLLIYVLITMSPLAPLALKSPRTAHAVTGECVGDCAICGCSAERRANHTCCCCQNKKKHQHDHEQESVPECCKKKHGGHKPALTSNCPCDSIKHFGLWGTKKSEQLPYHFIASLTAFDTIALVHFYYYRPTDRHGEPPDPPPKLIVLS